MKATQQGELVQIDHASIVVPGVGEIKHFSAVCPFTKYAVHHLWVLSPRSPKLNGVVERGNGTVQYEFYAQYDKHASWHHLRRNLQKFVHFYNFTRPHQGILVIS